jgi:murein DD-endopeptidase MepM/ murein hydrolase activator NlpD
VSRSSAVLERPEAESETAAPVDMVEPAPRRTAPPLLAGRRLPHPPGRRAPLWFAALILGAVLAAVPSLVGGGSAPVTISASDYGLGGDSELSPTGGMDDAGVHRGITAAEAQARLGELAASRAAREPRTVLPAHGVLTTCFCMRWGQMHWGIDLAAPLGTPIYSATDGVVLRAGPASGFGNAVYIQDADGTVHVYGHMKYYNVQAGQIVHAGDQIAKVGDQGQSTGPHLHYEIRRGGPEGKAFDPIPWLAEHGVHI